MGGLGELGTRRAVLSVAFRLSIYLCCDGFSVGLLLCCVVLCCVLAAEVSTKGMREV